MKVLCENCNKEFNIYPAWVKKGAGKNCSRVCAFESRKGRPSYHRTDEHRERMSIIVKSRDLSANSERFLKINAAKKGKSYQELYPSKAEKLLERYKLQVGEGNPNWKGGKHRQKYPYIFYRLRSQVIERDNLTCQNCYMTDAEARGKDTLGRGLTVHHIDYDKENNVLDNLITLCKWCNSLANSERKKWQTKYARLLLGQ